MLQGDPEAGTVRMKRSQGLFTEGENRYPDDTSPIASGAPAADELIGELCTASVCSHVPCFQNNNWWVTFAS